ncbi:MAG: cyclic nucleotide-binding domain-containing protein [Bacteroidota bacterium]
MMIEKLKKRIQRVTEVNEELWNEIKGNSTVLELKKNDILIPFGDNNKDVYIILSGCLESSLRTTDGKFHSVWFYFENFFDIAVAMDSYFMNEPTKYQFKALEKTILVVQRKEVVDSWLDNYLNFNRFYRKDITKHLTIIYEINAYRLTNSPMDFFSYLNNRHNALFSRVPANKMANFIGISPEWFSKLQKKKGRS